MAQEERKDLPGHVAALGWRLCVQQQRGLRVRRVSAPSHSDVPRLPLNPPGIPGALALRAPCAHAVGNPSIDETAMWEAKQINAGDTAEENALVPVL